MGFFKSSVAVGATADESFAYVDDEGHLRSFVSGVEPDETFQGDGGWFHPGAVFRHRVDWHGSHSHGYVWVLHRGDAADLVAEVHTTVDREGLDGRLDAALFALQDAIERLQAGSSQVPRPEASASFVVAEVLRGLVRHLPADRRRELDSYLQRAPTLDGSPALEATRAARCRRWADEMAAADHPGLGRRAVGFVQHVRHAIEASDDMLVAAEGVATRRSEEAAERHGRTLFASPVVAGMDPAGVPEGFRQELDESDEAVAEAAVLAAHRGWDAVPWTTLLDDLFAV